MFFLGQGVPEDNAEAVKWYRKAVEQDHGEAFTNLGYMYDFGLGVAQDKHKAVEFYQQGAEKGSLNAMLNLGISYWKGEGTPRDLVQACKWLDLACFYTQRSSDMRLKWRVRGILDQVKQEMTKEQIRQAMQLGREWDASHRPR
jgi:TPR repeat protein